MKKIRKHIKTLFPILAIVLLAGLILSRVYSPELKISPEITIRSDEASDHIGVAAEVCGPVATTSYRSDIDGEPTFLNFDNPHPDQTFTALIWGENRGRWQSPPEELYSGRNVCVTGTIKLHEGDPEIIVSSPGQIRASE